MHSFYDLVHSFLKRCWFISQDLRLFRKIFALFASCSVIIFNGLALGWYLIVDELENHFNREIVSTLIRFYMDKKVNPKGAMLIFSTHYAELLDEFERNDNVYIVRNRGGITAENLSVILKRNDIKKSEAYQSGFLEGTVPMYDAYMALKTSLIRSHKEDE